MSLQSLREFMKNLGGIQMKVLIDKREPSSWPFVLTVAQIMAITGVGKNKILSLVQTGELPAKRVRGRWLINRESFMAWLKDNG